MNIYFFRTERAEVTFPVSDLSTDITDSLLTDDELKKDPDITAILNDTYEGIDNFYQKYNAKEFEKTTAQKKLNKIKVYFIVKSRIVHGKEVTSAVPIGGYDDLSYSVAARFKGVIDSLFHLRIMTMEDFRKADEIAKLDGSAVSNRAFDEILHKSYELPPLLAIKAPFGSDEYFPLEAFRVLKEFDVYGNRLSNIPGKMEIGEDDDYYGMIHDDTDYAVYDEKDVYDSSNYSMIDPSYASNVYKYATDIRGKKLFDGETKPTLLSRIKDEIKDMDDLDREYINWKIFNWSSIRKFVFYVFRYRDVLFASLAETLFKERSHLIQKSIIPVFLKLEDAQDLLITVLEEVNQPFRVRREIETANTPKYYRSLDYLDDSFSFQNRFFLPDPDDNIQVIKDFLRRRRFIKARNRNSSLCSDYYSDDKYQIKGIFYVELMDRSIDIDLVYQPRSQRQFGRSAPKWVWREDKYFKYMEKNFPDRPEAYETRDINKLDKYLLKESQKAKIVSMGLSDFLEFWNNHEKKNSEVLFIPSSDSLNKKKLPLLRKKPRDRFYDYQQKYRGSKKYDTDNYTYDITISS